ncbi:MAG: leucine-rich repeat domain-containing protein [Azonexus sp.]
MSSLAERIISHMIGAEMLFEDRLDDLVEKHPQAIPGSTPEAKRQTLDHWASYDPTRNKKYFMWYFKQFLKGTIKPDDHTLDHLRDMLSDFEHFLSMPAFDSPRDIYQYDYRSLEKTLADNRGLASKKDLKRGRENLGGQVVSTDGELEVVGFRDGNSLATEAWRAYDKQNPNWDEKPHYPTDPEYQKGQEPYAVDNLWCIRNPTRGADYIKNIPSKMFYVIRKGGWPYVGIVLGGWGSQIVNLHNRQIDTSTTEEIYKVMGPILNEYASKKWDAGSAASNLFGKLRIVRGELQPGETISGADLQNSSLKALPDDLTVNGDLNVSGTKLKALPNNLTVNGSLIISNTAISALPPGLKVKGSLALSGTKITALPQGLKVGNLDISNTPVAQLPGGLEVTERLNIAGTPITKIPNDMRAVKVEYSPETLSGEEIRRYFFFLRHEDLKKHFWKNPKVAGMNDEQKEVEWVNFQPGLMAWFQKAPTITQAVSAMFKPVQSEKRR